MRKWYPLLVVVSTFVASVLAFPRMPERVPIHWSIHGDVNGDAPRLQAALLIPCLLLVVWLTLWFLPSIDPWRANYAKMRGAYDLMVDAVLTTVAMIHFAVIGAAIGFGFAVARVIPFAVSALFIVLGKTLPQAKPNFWFGIRTPWTLTNPNVWERTHRVGGYLMVVAGVLGIVAAFFPIQIAAIALTVLGASASLAPVIYSYFAWKQEMFR